MQKPQSIGKHFGQTLLEAQTHLEKWRLEKCFFHYLVVICVFLMLAKARSAPAATKPVDEDNVLPLPSQRKLKRKHCSL